MTEAPETVSSVPRDLWSNRRTTVRTSGTSTVYPFVSSSAPAVVDRDVGGGGVGGGGGGVGGGGGGDSEGGGGCVSGVDEGRGGGHGLVAGAEHAS